MAGVLLSPKDITGIKLHFPFILMDENYIVGAPEIHFWEYPCPCKWSKSPEIKGNTYC